MSRNGHVATYAKSTSVPIERTRTEIEKTLMRYGAMAFAYINSAERAVIGFEAHGRRIQFDLPLPNARDNRFERDGRGALRSEGQRQAIWEQECRSRWRALLLVIKAKLEAVEAGITTFDDEFLAHIVLPDGQTVSHHLRPRLEAVYKSGEVQALFPHRVGINRRMQGKLTH